MNSKTTMRALAVAATMTACACVQAADGNALLDSCQEAVKHFDGEKADVEKYKAPYCLGLIQGTRNTMTLLDHQDGRQPTACVPTEVTNAQLTRIVVKYLRANPEKLHRDATVNVLLALIATYPCPAANVAR